ncbi:hypothetical protein PF010_g2114 [Phytophthora fragariae]|uniref:Uncharacterized protein n=1 Tax=Phytophthora fragariae TaxID=53985 RepID=A0A6G0LYP2_9STRA|nr:hypothetical protein PF010_g2114 [Phytophthora fragariae]KAE9252490.1 hypothetical protein PF004_g1936 [Phytophthora fragariae]
MYHTGFLLLMYRIPALTTKPSDLVPGWQCSKVNTYHWRHDPWPVVNTTSLNLGPVEQTLLPN